LTLETLSTHPVILLAQGFLPFFYCDHVVNVSDKHMQHSTVSHMHNTRGSSDQWRTSTTHWLNAKQDPLVSRLHNIASQLTHIDRSHQEHVQVLRYYPSQQYDSHWDYFEPSLYRGTDMENTIKRGKNRLATVFWYMSDVSDGGWTYFPRSGKLPDPKVCVVCFLKNINVTLILGSYSYKLKKVSDCKKGGLLISPKKGNAILFYSMTPSGGFDELSLHGACPVGEKNIKWAANLWIWSKPVTFL
ncbi:hypothetical protein RFI_10623, partial [Reticulomyxa filosa]